MAKTYSNLFNRVVDFSNLLRSFRNASKGKKHTRIVQHYSLQLEKNLFRLQERLVKHTWAPGESRTFTILEPKLRKITAPAFEDRIVHHAIYSVINELFDKKFIYHSYACRSGKGNIAAVNAVYKNAYLFFNKYKSAYVVKADISKYFDSINHDILLAKYRNTIEDRALNALISTIIAVPDAKNGVVAGALINQLSANIYLNDFDHHITDNLGFKYYRYMDDFIILTKSKCEALYLLKHIEDYLYCNLTLKLNPKTSIFPISKPIDFCGYVIHRTHKTPRKRNVKRWKSRLKHLKAQYANGLTNLDVCRHQLVSLFAYLKHCKAFRLSKRVSLNFVLQRN